jgi:putative nucleotidyltransferase with HDIG domain
MVFLSLLHALLNVVFMITLKIIFTDNFSDWQHVLFGIAFNGFFSGILALGLLTPLESLLNTASAFRLMDLSDLNNPLFRRFMLAAPGTYNHSVMVATLAENACAEIGANALLARVGAYYHDIGKMEQPEYFVENQNGNNKHDCLNPRLSVAVIKSHVKKGVEKCRQLHLPQEVIDIVAEHHGNGLVAYFYAEAKKQDDTVSPEEFSYPGNPPTSREAAVVMLADTSEAACRTLDKPTAQRLDKFIHQLIMDKVEHRQLDHCNLTFRDLGGIKDSFVRILAGYYHSRIEYPDQKDPEDSDGESI